MRFKPQRGGLRAADEPYTTIKLLTYIATCGGYAPALWAVCLGMDNDGVGVKWCSKGGTQHG